MRRERQSPPTKAFDADPSLEFEFFLAEKLKMTVGRMRKEMSAKEFGEWQVYFGRIRQRKEIAEIEAGWR